MSLYGSALAPRRSSPWRSRAWIDPVVGTSVAASGLLTLVVLGRGDLDLDLVLVASACLLAVAAGGATMVLLPAMFSAKRATPGAGYVIGMSVMILWGLPATFARTRGAQPSAAWTAVGATLLSFVIVVATVIISGSVRLPERMTAWRGIGRGHLRLLTVVSTLVVVAFAAVTWPPPLYAFVTGTRGRELDILRDESFASLQPALLAYAFGFVRVIVLPFVAAYATVRAMRGGGVRTRLAAVLAIVVAVTVALATLEKSLAPRALLVVAVAAFVASRRVPVRLMMVAVAGAAAVPFAIARQVSSASTGSIAVVEALVRRATILPSEVVVEYFHYIEETGHLGGATLPYVSKFLPGGPVDLPGEVYDFAFSAGPGVNGHANGAYVGFLWADFGWVGVVIGSVVVGLTLVILERVLRWLGDSPVAIAVRAVVFLQVLQLPSTSLFSSLLVFPFGLVDLVVVVSLWKAWTRTIGSRHTSLTPSMPPNDPGGSLS